VPEPIRAVTAPLRAAWRAPADLVRLGEWWSSKLPPLFAVAYLFLAGPPPAAPQSGAAALALLLVSAVATAAWGHLLNDLADAEVDRLSGRPRPAARLSRAAAGWLLTAALALAVAPWTLLPESPVAHGALGLTLALLALYSLPPVRLKERGLAGLLADALYAHALPMAITIGLFGAVAASAAGAAAAEPRFGGALGALPATLLVLWKLAQGLCGALASQIKDRKRDRLSGVRTWVSGGDRPRALLARRLLLRLLLPAQLLLFVLALAALRGRFPWLLPAYAVFLVAKLAQIHGVWKKKLGFYRRGYPGYSLLNDFHERWLPLVALAILVGADRGFLPLAIAHLLLFRNLLGDLLRSAARALGGGG
jgi:4-hydroxybenzoate polyprenyltransferase